MPVHSVPPVRARRKSATRAAAQRRGANRPSAETLECRRLFAGLLHIRDASVEEGDGETRNLSFWIDLDAPAGTSVVTASTSDGTASAAEGDYTATSQTFVFSGADSRKFFNVAVRGDTRDEVTETLTVTLSNTNGTAVITDGTAVGTIVEDDDHPPTVALGPVTPTIRDTPVGSIDVRFSEYVMGFDVSDLTLSRDGGPNLLTAAQTVSPGAAEGAWTLNNLAALTASGGGYLLSLSGDAAVTGIMDGDYNPPAGGASVGWSNYAVVIPDPGPVVAEGPDFRVNTYTTGNQAYPATAMDADGDFVVVWQSAGQDQPTGTNEGVYGQRYTADGAPRGGEFLVNTTVLGNQMRPQVAMGPAGDFVVVWESPDNSGTGIFAQRYDNAGARQGAEFRVNATTLQPQTFPTVAMAGDAGFIVAWVSSNQDLDGDGVYAQRFDPSGAPLGPELRANTQTQSLQRYPTAAMSRAGAFVVAWSSDLQDPDNSTGIYAQRFDSGGVRQAGEFRVNTYTISDQFQPSAAMDADGDFAVTWHGYEQGGAYGVFARRFDSGGASPGGEFRVSSTIPGFQRNTAVAMDDDGDLVIAWQDEHSGPSPGFTTVMARRFTPDGAPAAGEFVVNTTDLGHHRLPAAAMDADGDFVIAWAGYGQDPGDSGNQSGVYARRYGRARAPGVAAAYVRGTAWGLPFLSYLQAHALGSDRYGFALAGGADQLADLPWRNVNQVSVRFTRDVVVEQRHLVVRGVSVPVYPVAAFAYDPATHVATWTLGQTIAGDRIVLDLDGDFRTFGVVGTGTYGQLLDGDWATGGAFPSGDGTAAGDFRFRFDVLPGNVNRVNSVLADDFSAVKSRFFRSTASPGSGATAYTIFHDVDGNGSVIADDFSFVKSRFFSTLPGPEPAALPGLRKTDALL
jgi:hypothetical protein